jgi:hypothetical protein
LKKILIEDLNKIKNPFARSYARHLDLKRKSLSTLAEIRERYEALGIIGKLEKF